MIQSKKRLKRREKHWDSLMKKVVTMGSEDSESSMEFIPDENHNALSWEMRSKFVNSLKTVQDWVDRTPQLENLKDCFEKTSSDERSLSLSPVASSTSFFNSSDEAPLANFVKKAISSERGLDSLVGPAGNTRSRKYLSEALHKPYSTSCEQLKTHTDENGSPRSVNEEANDILDYFENNPPQEEDFLESEPEKEDGVIILSESDDVDNKHTCTASVNSSEHIDFLQPVKLNRLGETVPEYPVCGEASEKLKNDIKVSSILCIVANKESMHSESQKSVDEGLPSCTGSQPQDSQSHHLSVPNSLSSECKDSGYHERSFMEPSSRKSKALDTERDHESSPPFVPDDFKELPNKEQYISHLLPFPEALQSQLSTSLQDPLRNQAAHQDELPKAETYNSDNHGLYPTIPPCSNVKEPMRELTKINNESLCYMKRTSTINFGKTYPDLSPVSSDYFVEFDEGEKSENSCTSRAVRSANIARKQGKKKRFTKRKRDMLPHDHSRISDAYRNPQRNFDQDEKENYDSAPGVDYDEVITVWNVSHQKSLEIKRSKNGNFEQFTTQEQLSTIMDYSRRALKIGSAMNEERRSCCSNSSFRMYHKSVSRNFDSQRTFSNGSDPGPEQWNDPEVPQQTGLNQNDFAISSEVNDTIEPNSLSVQQCGGSKTLLNPEMGKKSSKTALDDCIDDYLTSVFSETGHFSHVKNIIPRIADCSTKSKHSSRLSTASNNSISDSIEEVAGCSDQSSQHPAIGEERAFNLLQSEDRCSSSISPQTTKKTNNCSNFEQMAPKASKLRKTSSPDIAEYIDGLSKVKFGSSNSHNMKKKPSSSNQILEAERKPEAGVKRDTALQKLVKSISFNLALEKQRACNTSESDSDSIHSEGTEVNMDISNNIKSLKSNNPAADDEYKAKNYFSSEINHLNYKAKYDLHAMDLSIKAKPLSCMKDSMQEQGSEASDKLNVGYSIDRLGKNLHVVACEKSDLKAHLRSLNTISSSCEDPEVRQPVPGQILRDKNVGDTSQLSRKDSTEVENVRTELGLNLKQISLTNAIPNVQQSNMPTASKSLGVKSPDISIGIKLKHSEKGLKKNVSECIMATQSRNDQISQTSKVRNSSQNSLFPKTINYSNIPQMPKRTLKQSTLKFGKASSEDFVKKSDTVCPKNESLKKSSKGLLEPEIQQRNVALLNLSVKSGVQKIGRRDEDESVRIKSRFGVSECGKGSLFSLKEGKRSSSRQKPSYAEKHEKGNDSHENHHNVTAQSQEVSHKVDKNMKHTVLLVNQSKWKVPENIHRLQQETVSNLNQSRPLEELRGLYDFFGERPYFKHKKKKKESLQEFETAKNIMPSRLGTNQNDSCDVSCLSVRKNVETVRPTNQLDGSLGKVSTCVIKSKEVGERCKISHDSAEANLSLNGMKGDCRQDQGREAPYVDEISATSEKLCKISRKGKRSRKKIPFHGFNTIFAMWEEDPLKDNFSDCTNGKSVNITVGDCSVEQNSRGLVNSSGESVKQKRHVDYSLSEPAESKRKKVCPFVES